MTEPQAAPRGVFAANLTPYDADGAPDRARFVGHAKWLLANGCDGVAPLGTTGEANSLSVDERLGLIAALGEAGITGARLIVGIGCTAIPDTVRLAKAALAIGAGGCLMLPPFYYKGASEDGLFAAFAETIERTGDERLRLYLYHIPQMSGVPLPLPLIERLVKAYPRIVVGMKDSSGDWENMRTTLSAIPGFQLFPGTEEFLLAGLRHGGVGCISATTNVTCAQAQRVYAGWQGGEADALQAHLTALRKSFDGLPAIPVLKAYLARARGDAAWRRVRPPFLAASEASLATLDGRFAAASFSLAAE
ncbi:MAG: dihydrodipicolinate synthase family protein [Alphaproteobacteria bacterium]